MRVRWYRRILTMALVLTIVCGSGYVINFAGETEREESTKQEVIAQDVASDMVIPGGMPIGIYMETNGVMILGTDEVTGIDGLEYAPAEHLVKKGDYIVGVGDDAVTDKKELVEAVSNLKGEDAILHVRRAEEYIDVKVKPVKCGLNDYKLGIWVRDNAQGLGTITFLTGTSEFGALGHGIHDVDTGDLLQIAEGTLYATSIRDIKKGTDGEPGGMEGIIVYNNYNILGSITKNTDEGIFGKIEKIDSLFEDQTPMEVGKKGEIEVGPAEIRCCVDGTVKNYEIRITKIDQNPKEINKGIELEVTDEKLLDLTGGIVQGMSGSPIIQNDKIVGAVTHVFVQNAAKGYGIFLENMLKNAKS